MSSRDVVSIAKDINRPINSDENQKLFLEVYFYSHSIG